MKPRCAPSVTSASDQIRSDQIRLRLIGFFALWLLSCVLVYIMLNIILFMSGWMGSSGSGNFILCDMHSLMPVGFFHVFIYE